MNTVAGLSEHQGRHLSFIFFKVQLPLWWRDASRRTFAPRSLGWKRQSDQFHFICSIPALFTVQWPPSFFFILFLVECNCFRLLWWLSGKESACQCRRHRFDPWSARSLGEGNGKPLQHSCVGNLMDRGSWRATVLVSQRVGHDLATEQQQHSCFTMLC